MNQTVASPTKWTWQRMSFSPPFIFFITVYSKFISSFLLKLVPEKICCKSSSDFDRLRSFLVFHRRLTIISPGFCRVRVRSSSIEFNWVRFLPLLMLDGTTTAHRFPLVKDVWYFPRHRVASFCRSHTSYSSSAIRFSLTHFERLGYLGWKQVTFPKRLINHLE